MPAAELSRLRAQINGLITHFGDPIALRRGLRDLLEMYANWAYRPGQALQPQPLLPSYRVPPLVMQQLEQELSRTCQEMPVEALAVVEELWRDEYLEARQLAALLLGDIPTSQAAAVLDKLRAWAQPAENFRMIDTLFRGGTTHLRRFSPELLTPVFEEWLADTHTETQVMGIRALIPLIEDTQFANLPIVYRLLSPLVQNVSAGLQTELQTALEALVRRSPNETAYFLRQNLGVTARPATARMIRRCLPLFEPTLQTSLRAALQAAVESR